MISMRRRLLLMFGMILLVTQLASAPSGCGTKARVDRSWWTTVPRSAQPERVDTEIAEAIASLLAPSLIMMIVTLLASFWAISWDHPPAQQLQQRLEEATLPIT